MDSSCPVLAPTQADKQSRGGGRGCRPRPRSQQPQGHSPGGVQLFAPCSRPCHLPAPCHLLSSSPASSSSPPPRTARRWRRLQPGAGAVPQARDPRAGLRCWSLPCAPTARVPHTPPPAPGQCCPLPRLPVQGQEQLCFHPQINLHRAHNWRQQGFSTAFYWRLCCPLPQSRRLPPLWHPSSWRKGERSPAPAAHSAAGPLPQCPRAFTFSTQRCSEDPRLVLPSTTRG